ncbi:hypothetical protein H8N00_03830, partial [Streptomyces sp. AC563]|nr:hypothetical protein [Streptomyces buecherae]
MATRPGPTVIRLYDGSLALAARIRRALIPPGRLGAAALRCTAGAVAAVLVLNAAHQAPILMAVAAGWWCHRAWALGPSAADRPSANGRQDEPAEPPADELAADPRRQLLEGVHALIGDRTGIHLAELYPALLERPGAAHLDEARLRAALLAAGLTIHRSMRVGDIEGRSGIKAADVQALLATPPPAL